MKHGYVANFLSKYFPLFCLRSFRLVKFSSSHFDCILPVVFNVFLLSPLRSLTIRDKWSFEVFRVEEYYGCPVLGLAHLVFFCLVFACLKSCGEFSSPILFTSSTFVCISRSGKNREDRNSEVGFREVVGHSKFCGRMLQGANFSPTC
jgi:hypothetical protein